MPGTTRYSATFDRPYEEDDRADSAPPANARRSRSLSWQAHSGLDGGRPYTPLGSWQPAPRSSSTDNGPSKPTEHIPTRTVAKTPVKTHNNPFQFVKVGNCSLYKKAEEQLKKTKEVKKQDILKEEEEEWQTNLDSWKSRRRKMSEDVFRRQEEIRQFELEEQSNQATQKKTKTFSEMVNSRATRGRALSLCLLSSPLDFQDWEFENKSLKNGSCSTFTDESEGNSTVNSEDEGVSMRGRLLHLDNQNNHTNGNGHIEQNSLKLETHNGNFNKLDLTANNGPMKTKEGSYIDSGLESISSSHRAGDTPDSGSDFSQDSNSSIDCDSPRAGVNILEEFSSKSLQVSPGQELNISISLADKAKEFGFSFQIDKDAGRVLISSVLEGSKAESSGVHFEDQITAVDGTDINSKNHAEITSMINKAKEKGKITLLLWRHNKTTNGIGSIEKHVENSIKQNEAESDDAKYQQYEKSIESENEMYVDDFEELQRQSELLKSNKTENTSTKSQGVYSLDVSGTSNQIPQAAPVNYLYPLSPVTELPSPADETKTMSSSLSSNPSTPDSNSEKENISKKTLKEADVQLNSSLMEKNKTTATSKSDVSKTAVPCDKLKFSSLNKVENKTECSFVPSSPTTSTAKDSKVSLENSQGEKPQVPSSPKKLKIKVKKNINSHNVIAPAKQNEDNLNSNIESLNIVFQSEPKNTSAKNQSNNIVSIENKNNIIESDLVPDILPVEKVAEEMEKLILEQLEEEERAKELATEIKCSVGTSSEHLLTAPPKLAEPPKEKPPPPPTANEGNQKEPSLKRVNSTKRIKKEIHKRRSNFLGIDSADENLICGESSVPPPPALEEILKAEMELDRQSRLKIENASTERLTLEEKEIMEKEREIIETLESEERMKNLINGTEMYNDASPTSPSDMMYEEDCIFSTKNERKRLEAEPLSPEEQQLNILEENQLREREEFIRKQEAGNSIQSITDPSFSVAASASKKSQSTLSSLTDKNSKVSLSDSIGDGKNISSTLSMAVSENKSSDCGKKVTPSEKPAVPPKPLKKKEAIRKERERLRQEQEALQREREEHRRKLMLEEEELKKHQKSHAPEASVSRLGPIPSLIPPNYPSQLTTTTNATPNARESASFPSRSHHGDTNGVAGSINSVELIGPSVVRQSKMPAPRKAVQNEAWGQQKMPSVRKQNHDSLTESRYNQNHWLIQEAEMRRIAELKERQQRVPQLPCSQTHLVEDEVCSNPPRVPVIPPPHNPHVNYAAVQDKMWNYGQSNLPSKKYPSPAVSKDLLHTVYPRETVSQQAPTKPSRVVPLERQEQMLSVSGRKRCSHCNEELGRGAAMIIESLQLYYHIHCFQCCVCQAQLGNGSCGTDVRVRNNKLHCHNCYSNDEAGLKFSQV